MSAVMEKSVTNLILDEKDPDRRAELLNKHGDSLTAEDFNMLSSRFIDDLIGALSSGGHATAGNRIRSLVQAEESTDDANATEDLSNSQAADNTARGRLAEDVTLTEDEKALAESVTEASTAGIQPQPLLRNIPFWMTTAGTALLLYALYLQSAPLIGISAVCFALGHVMARTPFGKPVTILLCLLGGFAIDLNNIAQLEVSESTVSSWAILIAIACIAGLTMKPERPNV